MPKVRVIVKANKEKLTAGRIANFRCAQQKGQNFLWCNEVQGLGVRATASGAKSYIFQAKVKGRSMRLTLGTTSAWSIVAAQVEARRLRTMIDQGNDPRQVKADIVAASEAAMLAKEAAAAALRQQQASKSVTAREAWDAYIVDRAAAMKDGKREWGARTIAHHEYFVQIGGKKITRGRRPKGPTTTRAGILVPLLSKRLADLDEKVIQAWLVSEAAKAPTSTAKAFSALRAFLTWCGKHEKYRDAVHSEACQSDAIKRKVPASQVKNNDSLRRAQIRPWFDEVRKIRNPIISAYLQCLLLTGARRNELAALQWAEVDFQWNSLTIRDKVEGRRTIPLTPYVSTLLLELKRLGNVPPNVVALSKLKAKGETWKPSPWVFSSPTSASGRLEEPRIPHTKALIAAGLPPLSLHGLRRSFSTLAEWEEVPVGIVAQIMGHKPSAIAEKHYIQRELDLLHKWHVKIEAWILNQAGIEIVLAQSGLRAVA